MIRLGRRIAVPLSHPTLGETRDRLRFTFLCLRIFPNDPTLLPDLDFLACVPDQFEKSASELVDAL